MNFRWSLVAVIGLVLLSMNGVPAAAEPFAAGPHVVEVKVYSPLWLPILRSRVRVAWRGGKILVRASSDGYLSAQREVVPPAEPSWLSADMVLRGKGRTLLAIDPDLKKIASAFFETGQEGFPADSYGFVVAIPRQNWPVPSPEALEIIDRRWRPIRSRREVTDDGEFYRIRVTVPRRELDLTEENWYVVFDTGEAGEAGKGRTAGLDHWLQRLRDLEQAPSSWETEDRPARLAEMLCRFLPRQLGEETSAEGLPETLARILQERVRFDRLHTVGPLGMKEKP